MKCALVLIFFIAVVVSAQNAFAADIFYFTSSPSSWVGHGLTQTYNSVTSFRYYSQGAYTNAVEFSAGGFDLFLVEPNSSLPTVGAYNATRWPFMGSGAGLDFSGNGRGDNTLTGSFNVLQADYDASGKIAAFAVNWTQYDEGRTDWWN